MLVVFSGRFASSTFRIGTRSSTLALIQAETIRSELSSISAADTVLVKMKSPGDIDLTSPLWKMNDPGVFTSFFKAELLNGSIDAAVHSFKDMPIDGATEDRLLNDCMSEASGSTNFRESSLTYVAAVHRRADPRDAILIRRSALDEIRRTGTMRVLSSSPRRKSALDHFIRNSLPTREPLSQVDFFDVRGNILTRVKKLFSTDSSENSPHGLVVAVAALHRLVAEASLRPSSEFEELISLLRECEVQIVPLSACPTAAAQGAISVEVSQSNASSELLDSLRRISCSSTYLCTLLERQLLLSVGGGCHGASGCTVIPVSRPGLPECFAAFLRIPDPKSPTSMVPINTLVCPAIRVSSRSVVPLEPLKNSRILCVGDSNPAGEPTDKSCRLVAHLTLFKRQALPLPTIPVDKDVFVSRTFPESNDVLRALAANHQRAIFSSGVKSWFKLARSGVFVTGCSDELGSISDPRCGLEGILSAVKSRSESDHRPIVTLSHDRLTDVVNMDKEHIPMYRLVPNVKSIAVPAGTTHVFFKSASSMKFFASFEEGRRFLLQDAVSVGCGIGRSFDSILNELRSIGYSGQLVPSLNMTDYLAKVSSGEYFTPTPSDAINVRLRGLGARVRF